MSGDEIDHAAEGANFLAAYQAGDARALRRAIVYCDVHGIPLWEWLSEKLLQLDNAAEHGPLSFDAGEWDAAAATGPGRPPVLTPVQCMDVGETYHRLWDGAAIIDAYADYYSDPKNWAVEKRIDELQQANLNPPKHLRRHRQALEQSRHIRGKELDKIGRRLSLLPGRPKWRQDIVKEITIEWCKRRYGIEITPRLVAECRAKYRRLRKRMRSYQPP